MRTRKFSAPKTLLVSGTHRDVTRDVHSEGPAGDVDLATGEILPDDDLDEALAMKKKWPKRSDKPGIVLLSRRRSQTNQSCTPGLLHLQLRKDIYQGAAQIRTVLHDPWC